MWSKIKSFLVQTLYDETCKPSQTRLFLAISFFLAWVAFFICMIFNIQNARDIIQSLMAIIIATITLKTAQAGVRNITTSVYDTPRGEGVKQQCLTQSVIT